MHSVSLASVTTITSMAADCRSQPSEQEVIDASSALLAESPALGIAKLLARLQNDNQWALSEKRLKNTLVQAGLRQAPHSQNGKTAASSSVPASGVDRHLPIPAGVRAVYFDKVKGKGLVADRDFQEGEVIFTEDAFIAAPPSHALADVEKGALCTQCFAPLSSSLVVPCGKAGCQARFCNRLCQSRAQSTHHAMLCPGQNASIKPFNRYLSSQKWLSLSLVARSLARILLSHNNSSPKHNDTPAPTLEETVAHFDAFATISELERRSRNPGWHVEQEAFISAMKEGHRLLSQGMDPRTPRKGAFPVRGHFPEGIVNELFGWETFLRLLGRANLNTEAQGGMYLVHSHLNHSCSPNTSVTHPPSRAGVRQATKVTVYAKRSIKTGEELFITYQDPGLSLARRRLLLWRKYMFGPCECERCNEELNQLDEEDRKEMEKGAWKKDAKEEEEVKIRKEHAERVTRMEEQHKEKLASETKSIDQKDLAGLEDELRASLGF